MDCRELTNVDILLCSLHELTLPHWSGPHREGGGGCQGRGGRACKEEGLQEEVGSPEGEDDEGLDT